jgi:hypothetical protein
MPDERLYGEKEVEQIFDAATTDRDPPHHSASTGSALTLRQLQDIGRQVGIDPERIADAARAIDSKPPAGRRFEMPLTVRRTVPLSRAPTEAEWLILVSELRETFDAAGRIGRQPGIYEWRNGNLHAYIEPTPSGYRLRMGTRKGNAVGWGTAGLAAIAGSSLGFAALGVTGALADGLVGPLILGWVGMGTLAAALIPLPRWARTRREQMEHIARRAQALLGSGDEAG